MNHRKPWADLHLKLQENLIHFLDVEVDLAGTLCDMAKNLRDPEDRKELLRNIKHAIDTVRCFAVRVVDRCTREIILDRADALEFKANKMTQEKRRARQLGSKKKPKATA